MRLLKRSNTGEFSLTKDLLFSDDGIPHYAILSHTWGTETEEVSFKDMMDGTAEPARESLATTRSGSAENKRDMMICSTFGSIRAASITQAASSSRRLSIPRFAGTVTRLNATCISRMSRDLAHPEMDPSRACCSGIN
jgi:hypothetical protein